MTDWEHIFGVCDDYSCALQSCREAWCEGDEQEYWCWQFFQKISDLLTDLSVCVGMEVLQIVLDQNDQVESFWLKDEWVGTCGLPVDPPRGKGVIFFKNPNPDGDGDSILRAA